ncbi:MAG TPA: AsmA family protein [Burkholderiales bacterium]|jgi:AsmA protein|nr:AsmA family protein [Burkholderiales bacterium]
MRILKYALFGLVSLVLVAVVAVLVVVDGAFVKSRLEQAMKAKNRTLSIEGTPTIRLYPVAGIALGKTSLSEAGTDRVFVALDSAEVAVRTMPLLSGEVAVETLKIAGLRANVVRHKDGSTNYSDLAGGKETSAKGEKPPVLRIAEVQIDKAQLSYRDEASGQELNVADLNVKTGRLDGQTPGDVSLAAHVTGKKPEVDLRAQTSGALRFDLAKAEFAFDKFSAQAKGRIDRDALEVDFSAPKVEVTPSRAAGSEVRGSVLIKGPQRNLNAKLRIAAVEGTAKALTVPNIALELDAAMEHLKMKASLQAALKANLEKQDLDAEVSGKLDEAAVKVKLALTNFAPLAATFDASFDRLNVDQYLPPEKKEAKADDRVDLAPLKGRQVSGKLAVGNLVVKHVKMENVKAEMKLADGKLEISPMTANLYGGSTTGSLVADSNGNKVHVKEAAQNVAIGALLRDAANKDLLEGKGSVALDVQTAGATVPAMKKALAGSAHLAMKDGAIKGFNLADTARNVKSAVGMKTAKPDPSQKTDFSELSASFNIKNGVAHNEDLKAQSPFLRLGGAGNIDIGNSTIDYTAKATLVATSKGQGGRTVNDVAGVTVPVKLSGALDSPTWNVDYSALVGSMAGGALGKAAGSVTDSAKKGAGSVTDKVRGLFGR